MTFRGRNVEKREVCSCKEGGEIKSKRRKKPKKKWEGNVGPCHYQPSQHKQTIKTNHPQRSQMAIQCRHK